MNPFSDNLALLRSKQNAIRQIIAGEYREIVSSSRGTLQTPPSPDEIARLFSSLGEDPARFPRFCQAFCEAYPEEYRGATPFSDPDTEHEVPERIAYMQNAFSDRAYRVFSALCENPRAIYYPGFREVAEEVYAGRASHAILPVANSSDGQLLSFRRLILRYDLRIIAVTDVATGDEQSMRFALLHKGIPAWEEPPSVLDMTAVLGDELSPGAFLSACETLGAALLSVDSHPLESEEEVSALDLQFDMTRADWSALYLYLEGSHVRYETVGCYTII